MRLEMDNHRTIDIVDLQLQPSMLLVRIGEVCE